jgi:hypothetical protein
MQHWRIRVTHPVVPLVSAASGQEDGEQEYRRSHEHEHHVRRAPMHLTDAGYPESERSMPTGELPLGGLEENAMPVQAPHAGAASRGA